MIYKGHQVDPISLWGKYVDFPPDAEAHLGGWLPRVKCPNPSHQTEKKHFGIHTGGPGVNCFAGCGISGSWEHAIATIEGCDEREARKIILRHRGVSLDGGTSPSQPGARVQRGDPTGALEADERAFAAGSYAYLPEAAKHYLASRGLDGHAIFQWDIGYDPANRRIVIPARDHRHTVRFLIRRTIGRDQPKYLYTANAPKANILFGECYLDRDLLDSTGIVLVEGSIDAIRLHRLGFRNTVATLGSGLSKQQSRRIYELGPRRIYTLFDKDFAGIENTFDVDAKMLNKFSIFVCRYPADKNDPAELSKSEVAEQIQRAITIGTFTRNVRELKLTRR